MSEITPNAITRLYRACDPSAPLEVDDPRYVNCDDVRGTNLAQVFARSLWRSDPLQSEVKVFAGHRGVGKTSELLRLKHMLEHPEEAGQRPFLVIFSDVTKSLDLNDLDFPDLLVFMAGEVQRQLAEAEIPGFTAVSEYLSRLWDDLLDLLKSEVTLSGAGVDIPYAGLALELKNRPNSRTVLRKAIEQQSTSLIDAVNDLLQKAMVKLRESEKEGLVLIIDGLDKLIRRDLEGTNTHDRLFVHRSEQLVSLGAHVIYTVPISLIYSPQFTQLEQTFGEHQIPVSMIRLRDDELRSSVDTPGMKKMREMIEARCRSAKVQFADVFDEPETCDRLCEMTGGHPRHLMMFLQTSVNGVDDLPVTRESVEQAIHNYGNSLLRGIPDDYWSKLRRVDEPQDSISRDTDHQEMLFNLHIFEYMNHRPWYEVNPVIRGKPRFKK